VQWGDEKLERYCCLRKGKRRIKERKGEGGEESLWAARIGKRAVQKRGAGGSVLGRRYLGKGRGMHRGKARTRGQSLINQKQNGDEGGAPGQFP